MIFHKIVEGFAIYLVDGDTEQYRGKYSAELYTEVRTRNVRMQMINERIQKMKSIH